MLAKEEIAILTKGLAALSIEANDSIMGRFEKYLDILQEYQNKVHLISHGDHSRISLRHFLPSLAALPYIGEPRHACDIGAGAGFPSIPIKIIRPDIEFMLFESTKKKARFLDRLVRELELDGIEIIADRAEKYDENVFDLVLARAAGRIADLVRIIAKLLRTGGKAILFKSANIRNEVTAASKRLKKFKLNIAVKEIQTPLENRPMALVILQKD